MINVNNNHHHYLYNSHGTKPHSREQTKAMLSSNFTNDSSNSNLNTSTKGRNPVIGITSATHGSKPSHKQSRKSSRGPKKIEDPAIPFPQSQKHHSSKLNTNEQEFVGRYVE